MPRPPRDPRLQLDRPGQRPILQGHLRRDRRPIPAQPPEPIAPPAARVPPPAEDPNFQPSEVAAAGQPTATRGKATSSRAKTSARRNLEGSEQGPA